MWPFAVPTDLGFGGGTGSAILGGPLGASSCSATLELVEKGAFAHVGVVPEGGDRGPIALRQYGSMRS